MANEIKASFKFDTKQAERSLKGLGQTSNKAQGAISKLGSKAASAVKGFATMKVSALGAAVGVAAFTAAAFKAIQAFDKQVDSINRLNLALANQGNLLPGVSQNLQEFASAQQNVTTFGDEVILQNAALLASFGANEEVIKKTTIAALDFATAQGIDLKAATLLLGKAIVGETSSLSRYGVIIDQNVPKTEKFDEVLRQLTERFGGSAQLAAQTFSGQMTQVGNAAGDALEGVGKFVNFLATSFGGGVEGSLSLLARIGKFFSEDLIIGIGIARGALLDFGAGFISVIASIIGALESIPIIGEQFAGAAQGLDDFANALRFGAEELRSEAREVAAASGANENFKNQLKGTIPVLGEADEATKKYEDSVTSLADKLGGEGLLAEAKKTTDAIQQLGGVSELSATGIESLSGLIDNLRKNAEQLSPELREVAQELNRIALLKGIPGLLDDMEQLPITTEQWNEELSETSELLDGVGPILEGVPPIVGVIDESIGGLKAPTLEWNDALSAGEGIMNALGIESDSTFGKIFSGITGVLGAIFGGGGGGGGGGLFGAIAGIFGGGGGGGGGGGIGGILSGVLGGGGGLGGILSGVLGGGGGIGGAISSALGGIGGAGGVLGGLGGAISGIGGALGGLLGGIGPIALAAGPFAPLAIGIGFAIRAMLKKASADTTAGAVGIEFDNLSEDLQKRIQEMGEEVGDFATGLQLNLGEIFAQGGLLGGIDQFSEKIADAFSFLERGDFTIEEAFANISANIPQLLAQFDQLGSEGTDNVERLLRAAADTGMEFEGQREVIAAFSEQMVDAALQGGDAWLNATNSLGVSGRETLEFLKNEFGAALPEKVRLAIEALLGVEESLAGVKEGVEETVATAATMGEEFTELEQIANVLKSEFGIELPASLQESLGGATAVGEEFAKLPDIASEAVNGIAGSFAEGSASIVDGLTPVSDKIATEIREAGESTSEAIDVSFSETSAAIQAGLESVAGVFSGQVAPAALAAADATRQIAEAAREAATASRDISFPGGPGAPPTQDFQHGGFLAEGPRPQPVTVAGPGTGGEFMIPAKGAINVSMPLTVNVGGGSNVRALVDALEANQADQAERLKRILK